MNTHHGYIQHLDNSVEFIAAGPESFVREHLPEWIAAHPLGEFDTAFIVQIVEEIAA